MDSESLQINIDPDELMIEDMEAIEDVTRTSFDKLKAGHLARAIVFVSMKKTNPEFTWEDAGKVKMKQINNATTPLDEPQEEESPESQGS